MIPMAATRRRLGGWFAGVLLIAQIFGIVPLIGGHTAHVAETELVRFQDNTRTASIPHRHHYHGDADGFIQHHELQDLSGVFPCLISRCEIAFVSVAIITSASDAVAESEPALLERPPKTFLSI